MDRELPQSHAGLGSSSSILVFYDNSHNYSNLCLQIPVFPTPWISSYGLQETCLSILYLVFLNQVTPAMTVYLHKEAFHYLSPTCLATLLPPQPGNTEQADFDRPPMWTFAPSKGIALFLVFLRPYRNKRNVGVRGPLVLPCTHPEAPGLDALFP